jgi:hypothetical protein
MMNILDKKSSQRLLQNDLEEAEQLSLDHFTIGPMIAKGCCGAVYEAKYEATG